MPQLTSLPIACGTAKPSVASTVPIRMLRALVEIRRQRDGLDAWVCAFEKIWRGALERLDGALDAQHRSAARRLPRAGAGSGRSQTRARGYPAGVRRRQLALVEPLEAVVLRANCAATQWVIVRSYLISTDYHKSDPSLTKDEGQKIAVFHPSSFVFRLQARIA